MVVTGVTATQPLMSPGHLAACREPWVMTKLCTPPAHLLSAFWVGARCQSSSWLLHANSPNLATNTPVRHGSVRGRVPQQTQQQRASAQAPTSRFQRQPLWGERGPKSHAGV